MGSDKKKLLKRSITETMADLKKVEKRVLALGKNMAAKVTI